MIRGVSPQVENLAGAAKKLYRPCGNRSKINTHFYGLKGFKKRSQVWKKIHPYKGCSYTWHNKYQAKYTAEALEQLACYLSLVAWNQQLNREIQD